MLQSGGEIVDNLWKSVKFWEDFGIKTGKIG